MGKYLKTTLTVCLSCERRFLEMGEHQRLLVLAREAYRGALCTRCTGRWAMGGRTQAAVERRLIKNIVELEASTPRIVPENIGGDR